MASFVPSSPDTLVDQDLYTRARLTPIACSECLASVGVKKNSDHHTSIQWSADAADRCPEMASDLRQRSCPRLLASIESALASGELSIGAEDGY